MTELHPDERAMYEAQLRHRARSLARLLATSQAPPSAVVALFVGNLLRAAVPLCGDALAAELLEWLGRTIREASGRCPFCGAERPVGAVMCARCVEEADAYERDVLLDSAGGLPS